jgi:hypothetical protein
LAAAEESRPEPSTTTGTGEPVVSHIEEEAPRKPSSLTLPVYLALRP